MQQKLDLAKEIICELADGLEKKATEHSTERPKDRKYRIQIKRYGKEWLMAISKSSRTGERMERNNSRSNSG